MIPAQVEIKRIETILRKAKGNDPQDWLDEDCLTRLKARKEKLESGLEDYFDNKRKEKDL